MLNLSSGQVATFEYFFNEDGNFYDPTAGATPSDVIISIYRGDFGSGALIDGPFSFFHQAATPNKNYIEKTTDNIVYYGTYGQQPGLNNSNKNAVKFSFYYTIPDNIFPGNYSVVATTYSGTIAVQYTAEFQVTQSSLAINAAYASGQKEISKAYVPTFEKLEQYKTNSVLLIGHADGISLNNILRITSIQEAIDLLKADFTSPLLRGVFDAYSAGARDIYICAAAPMKEYIENPNDRLTQLPIYSYEDATPLLMNFYQRYYDRLKETYKIIINYDYLDIVVPLETSIINTGSIDFATQLAQYCQDFHNLTGFIQVGVIGSRSNGVKVSDIQIFESNINFSQKYTMFDSDNQIIGDMGRFIVPIYGELIMNHNFLNITYVSTGAAVMAGMISDNPVNESLIRKKVFPAFGLSGVSFSQIDVDRLDAIGVNTFTRGSRSRRGNNYEIYLSNDNTMAHPTSNYRKLPQIRLAAMIINEIMAVSSNNISKFSSQKVVEDVNKFLYFLKYNNIIKDFQLEAYADSFEKGKLYFDISVISSLGLKKLSFSISSGKGS